MNLLLLIGATLRLTRFVTTDSLGGWLISEPAKKWATSKEGGELYYAVEDEVRILSPHEVREYHEHSADVVQPNTDLGARSKLVSGLDCPFCVGTWIAFALLASYSLAKRSRVTLSLWRFITGGLSLNYLTAHLNARLDD